MKKQYSSPSLAAQAIRSNCICASVTTIQTTGSGTFNPNFSGNSSDLNVAL